MHLSSCMHPSSYSISMSDRGTNHSSKLPLSSKVARRCNSGSQCTARSHSDRLPRPPHHPSSLNSRHVRHPINQRIHSLPPRFRGTRPPRITDTKPLVPRRNRQIRISQISLTLHLATNPLPDPQIKSLIIGIRLDAEGPGAWDGGFGGAGEPVCWLGGGCRCCGIPFGAVADHAVAVLGVG
jgi:hypothetical protein